MARNYSLTTIKALFAEAAACAVPDCAEGLISWERGRPTVLADIAHIRSEVPGGPRHDPTYSGDLNGVSNLLLLCLRHHRPVDRHAEEYSIAELEQWKASQRAAAGNGTTIPESELRHYVRLSDDERRALAQVARLTERMKLVCFESQVGIDSARGLAEQERLQVFARLGTVYEVAEDGTRTPMSHHQFNMTPVEQRRWEEQAKAEWESRRPRVEEARLALGEELGVLRMMTPSLRTELGEVLRAADSMCMAVGSAVELEDGSLELEEAVSRMWSAANGNIES